MQQRIRPGPVVTFDAGPADTPVRVDVWDRFTSWGEKRKGELPVTFDETTLGQMVDNWRSRGGRLAMCQDHKSANAGMVAAPALAFYDALAVVRAGQVVRFESLVGSTAAAPDPEILAARVAAFAAGDVPEPDGLWGWRCEVTPLGEDPREGLRNYRGISPMFTTDGTDEQGRSIGYVLYDVAATNTAFQAGCEITFSAAPGAADQTAAAEIPASKERPAMEEMLKMLGLGPDASAEDAMKALKKLSDDLAEKGEKLAKLEADKGEEKPDDEDKDAAKEAMGATIAALSSKLAKLEAAGAAREASAAAEREAKFSQLADAAIAGGYPKERREALIKFARTDFDGAREAVAHLIPKTGAPAHLFDRMSAVGAPIGKSAEARETSAPLSRTVKSALGTFVEIDAARAAEIRRVAESKDPAIMGKVDALLAPAQRASTFNRLLAAEKIVKAERPDLTDAE